MGELVFAGVQVLLNSPHFSLNLKVNTVVYRYPMDFLPHTFYYS